MILTLYNYTYRIPVTISRYSGKLGNVTMFDDTLVLHKNMNNVFQLTITDRDRVRLKLDEDSTLQVKFRIISEDDVVVSSSYLESKFEGDFWQMIIPKEEVNALTADGGYRFAVTMYKEDAGGNFIEEPLYVDHNFKLMGYVEVHDNFFDIKETSYYNTEPVVDHFLDSEEEFEAKHFFTDVIYNDGNIHKIEVVSNIEDDEPEPEPEPDEGDNGFCDIDCVFVDGEPVPPAVLSTPPLPGPGLYPDPEPEAPVDMEEIIPIIPKRCYVTLEKNLQTHYPITPKNDQWTPVTSFYGIGTDDTEIDFSKIPLKTYGRILIHTKYPENFTLKVHRIDR